MTISEAINLLESEITLFYIAYLGLVFSTSLVWNISKRWVES